MNKTVNKIGLVTKPHKLKYEVITCEEQGRFCLKKFIKTRVDQPNMCVNCLKMLDMLDSHPLPVSKVKRNLWN